jgi:ArsR family transcriptional regulator
MNVNGDMDRQYQTTARFLKALAHPVRLQILDLLRHGEVCVCHIESALDKRQAYVSQQLIVLREAGLVDARRDGLQVYYRLTSAQARELIDTLCGPPTDVQHPVIEGCPCPSCSSIVPLAAIQGESHHVTG